MIKRIRFKARNLKCFLGWKLRNAFLGGVVVLLIFFSFSLTAGAENKTNLVPKVIKNRFSVAVKGGGTNLKSIRELKEMGINVVFNYSGVRRELLRKNDIVFFLNVNVFFSNRKGDKEFAAIDHRGRSNVEDPVNPDEPRITVCPTQEKFRSAKIEEIVNKVKRLAPDGVSLDFIRYPVHWETVKTTEKADQIRKFCFCDRCLARFQKEMQITIPAGLKGTSDKAAWILKNYRESWKDWRCGIITSMVKEIRTAVREIKPDILIDIHAVPWRLEDYDEGIRLIVGQDFKELALHVDVFSPMVYHHMLRRRPEWIHSVVFEMDRLTRKPIWPCIQVISGKDFWRETPLSLEDFKEAVLQAMKSPAQGISVISWGRMKKSKDKMNIYRSFTKKPKNKIGGY